MKRQLKEHKRLLRRIAADTRHLRRTHAIDAPESVFESDASNASIIDKLADREPDQAATLHATFESLVLAPQVYKKTFTGMLEPTTDDQSDDTRTITNFGLGDETSKIDNAPGGQWALWPDAPHWVAEFLDTDGTWAWSLSSRNAETPGELDLEEEDNVRNLQRLDATRFTGQVTYPNAKDGRRGMLHREDIGIVFILRQTVTAIAKENHNPGVKGFQKGDELRVTVSALSREPSARLS